MDGRHGWEESYRGSGWELYSNGVHQGNLWYRRAGVKQCLPEGLPEKIYAWRSLKYKEADYPDTMTLEEVQAVVVATIKMEGPKNGMG